MGVFHIFKIVQMVPTCVERLICSLFILHVNSWSVVLTYELQDLRHRPFVC